MQVHGGLGRLRLVLVPGNENALLEGGDELHGRDPRARREPGSILDRLAGDTRHLQHPFHAIVVPQHGIVPVEVPAAAQLHLPAAVDDLAVRKIGMLFPFHHRLAFIPVQRQRDPALFAKFHQQRHQPGIAPGGQDHVRVIAPEVGAQADQKRDAFSQAAGNNGRAHKRQ